VNSEPRRGNTDALAAPRPALMLRGNDVSCRVQQWAFQPQTAQLVLYHQLRLPSLADLQRWTDQLRELGYTRVRTTALAATAGLRAESAGFHVIQDLVLLEHLAPRDAPNPTVPTARLLAGQREVAATIDVAAFTDHWALDSRAIADVCSATPRNRARSAGSPTAAYAITGRDGKQGFLQRLAVHPQAQRQGLGRGLVQDSLQWLARWRVQRVLVNTPTDNIAALTLYEQTGFRRLSERLRVYEMSLA